MKLNKIGRAGLAIGLSLIMAFSATGCGGTISFPDSSYTSESQQQSEYIDLLNYTNELQRFQEPSAGYSILLNNYSLMAFQEELASHDYSFKMSPYYGIDEVLALYQSTTVNKQNNNELLTNGKLDAQKLKQKVIANNKNYMSGETNTVNAFYTDISGADLDKICTIIANVANSNFNGVKIEKIADTLTQLTIFERTGSASNAYVTDSLTFIYNPSMTDMYADMQEIAGNHDSKEETVESVLTHEVMHLLQYSVNDRDNSNGVEAGMFRKYNTLDEQKVPVDSLWNSWLLEASAELGMQEYLGVNAGTYYKKITYANSYNISRFNELDLRTENIEDTAFNSTLEETYQKLHLDTPEKQREFLNFLYSIEITQTDPDEFWDHYTATTGITPSESEKLAIRMDIRQDAVKFLSRNFYSNLANAVAEGKITDSNTLFYLMRTWEIDSFVHLEYSKTESLPHATDFITWQANIQHSLFENIAQSSGKTVEDIEADYNNYTLQTKVDDVVTSNCSITSYSPYTNAYLTNAKNNYATSKFVRISDIAQYLANIETKNYVPTETKETGPQK